jgi:N6-adenosine-specific RNA methylase IME4
MINGSHPPLYFKTKMTKRTRDENESEKRKKYKPLIKSTNQSLLETNGDIKRTIVYADPPWKYTIEHHPKGTTMSGLANQHYATMSLEELKQLKVKEIVSEDAILFLWTTGPQMKNSINLMNAWGFTYKTMFMVWVKTTKGEVKANRLGHYTRQCCEYVLMGSRGNVLKYKNREYKMATLNFFQEDSKKHSQKPLHVSQLIDQMFFNVPKIELFARGDNTLNSCDWDYWGNEIGGGEKMDRNTSEWKERRNKQVQLYEERSKVKRVRKQKKGTISGSQASPTSVEEENHVALSNTLELVHVPSVGVQTTLSMSLQEGPLQQPLH